MTTAAGFDNAFYIETPNDVYALSLRECWNAIRTRITELPEFNMLSYACITANPGGLVTLSARWGLGFSFEAVVKKVDNAVDRTDQGT